MTLDPQLSALLEQLSAEPAPKLWEAPIEDGRALYRAMAQMLDVQGIAIGKVEDQKIPGPAGDIPVRIYTPVAAGSEALPCLVYYHGGGMAIGDLDTHDALCRQFSNEAGAKVVAIDYRLAPEHKFPAAVDDAFAALKWVEDTSSDLGIDPNRIAVAGDSAGGNLSAVVTQMARDNSGPQLVFQLLIYPWTDADPGTESREKFAEGYFLEKEAMNWFADQYLSSSDQHDDPRMSPLRASDFSGLPSALVITAGFDPLKDEGRAYAEALKKAGVPVIYKDYAGMIHGFFGLTAVSDVAREAVNEAAQSLKQAFAK